ncbi:hypothetical protein GCM10012275_35810 [Longimycelium tulufanense]|uniref:Exonuclease domain-containing protein n=1 Tax=Longimycelium tulufanense TaxID=907463 RepID=A0A8J3FWQ4_9PSEU|nr:exonuclease domain-containing protein [Longimycelium tulufanense]GGM61710.1 hypothetical protein GCM10012275_35810 [Longimycelium tulufanense]
MDGYAVVDLETTGVRPGLHDRVIEVAIVHLDRNGTVTEEWCTLVNPLRDLGPRSVHRINAADVRGAPTFDRVAGGIVARLRNRVLVAHKLSFDATFLRTEFARLGIPVPIDGVDGLCTMRLAEDFLGGAARSLSACCTIAGIRIDVAHSALHDARAAAHLFGYYLRLAGRPEPWQDLLFSAGTKVWPHLGDEDPPTLRRGEGDQTAHFLSRLDDRTTRRPSQEASETYLQALDNALLDRYLSLSEQDSLVELAHSLGIGSAAALELHRTYLASLTATGRGGEEGQRDLRLVADLLGLPPSTVDILRTASGPALRTAPRRDSFRLSPGDRVVFTGETEEPREWWEQRAAAAGLAVTPPNVSRKTRLVVAADPDSLSSKAQKARAYGIPIITEEAFTRLLMEMSEAPPGAGTTPRSRQRGVDSGVLP